eukprot:gene7876-16118_t
MTSQIKGLLSFVSSPPPLKSKPEDSYHRVVGTRENGDKEKSFTESMHVPLALISDRFLKLFSAETEEERILRSRLLRYRGILEKEMQAAHDAMVHHATQSEVILNELQEQEGQIRRWGLIHILLQALHMQAWIRRTRCTQLLYLASEAHRILQEKVVATDTIAERLGVVSGAVTHTGTGKQQSSSSSSLDDPGLPSSTSASTSQVGGTFFKSPEALWNENEPLRDHLRYRLPTLDSICSLRTQQFRKCLPAAERQSFPVRQQQLLDTIKSYAELMASPEPRNLETDSWKTFCNWFLQRQTEQADLEKTFAGLVEDEREREGRLFRSWCFAVLPESTLVSQSLSVDPMPEGFKPYSRTVIAFIQYFSSQILVPIFQVPVELHNTVTTLTEVLVYRRLSPLVLRYSPPEGPSNLLRNDLRWRRQCLRCRLLDPVNYGIADCHRHRPREEWVVQNGNDNGHGVVTLTGNNHNNNSYFPTKKVKQPLFEDSNSEEESESDNANAETSLGQGKSLDPDPVSWVEKLPCVTYKVPVGKTTMISTSTPATTRSVTSTSMKKGIGSDTAPCSFSSSSSFHVIDKGTGDEQTMDLGFGQPYVRSIRVFSLMTSSVCPRHIVSRFMLAIRWVHKDVAAMHTGREGDGGGGGPDYLGADMLFPILVLVICNAQLPTIHLLLYFITHYASVDYQGEAAYYLTCLEAVVAFIMQLQIPSSTVELADRIFGPASSDTVLAEESYELELKQTESRLQQEYDTVSLYKESSSSSAIRVRKVDTDDEYTELELDFAGRTTSGHSRIHSHQHHDVVTAIPETVTAAASSEDCDCDNRSDVDLRLLDESRSVWLRNQEAMEDTLSILQQDGWMI